MDGWYPGGRRYRAPYGANNYDDDAEDRDGFADEDGDHDGDLLELADDERELTEFAESRP